MEFDFDLNKVLPNTITFVDHKRFPFRNHTQNAKLLQKQLDKVIDTLGDASAKAQGLHTVITTAFKLQHSDHQMYILKDTDANGGLGAAVGMIKVGRKTLFLLDIHGIQHEVVPLCVLDFYVHTSRQRNGFGKKLFEHMLQIHNLQPAQVAIDRPSHKFQSFLKKHYGLQKYLSQPNKFLVFDQFFKDLNAVGYVPRRSQRLRSSNTVSRPPPHPYQRSLSKETTNNQQQQAPARRLSTRRSSRRETPMDIDCDASPSDITETVLPPLVRSPSQECSGNSIRSTGSAGSRESSATSRGLTAQANLYSRHGSADMNRGRNPAGQTWTRNAMSAGKSLHASSQDNPLAFGHHNHQRHFSVQSPLNSTSAHTNNSLNAVERKGALAKTGSYTLTSVLNSQQSSSSLNKGTSWNIFGIPPVETNVNLSSQKYSRTFPF